MEQYTSNIYKSKDGRHLLHNLYRKYLMAIDVPVRECMVETSFGDTHIVRYGNPQGKPVLAFYGELAFNPLAIRPFTKILDLDKIQLIVPDPVGQIGFSAEKSLSFSKKEYSEWAIQIMNGLDLQTVSVLGYSFGGNIALQFCANAALRVERLLLMMPGGIASVSSSKSAKLTKPALLKDEKEITDEVVKKALQPILTFPQEDIIEAARMIFLHTIVEKTSLTDVKKKDIKKFRSPVYLIAEKSDYLFPGESVQKKAQKIIPRLEGSRLLKLGCHCGLFQENDNEDLKEACNAANDFLLRTF